MDAIISRIDVIILRMEGDDDQEQQGDGQKSCHLPYDVIILFVLDCLWKLKIPKEASVNYIVKRLVNVDGNRLDI